MAIALAIAACAPATPVPVPTQAPVAVPTAVATTTPAATTAAAPPAATGTLVKLAQIQGFGLFLTDDAGRTLYAFDNDKKDTSTCTATCAQNWLPFTTKGSVQAGDRINASLLSTFIRADGTTQVEYDGHPLYYFAGDKNPGDVNGHGVGNVWHVLSPRGSPMTNPAPTKAP